LRSTKIKYQLASGAVLKFVSWGEEEAGVVYNVSSGDTHLVTKAGEILLQLLQKKPQTILQLVDEVARFPEVFTDDERNIETMQELLVGLKRIDLIEPTII